MALDNLISVSFTEEELTQFDEALTVIENIIKSKAVVSLTPEQRRQYGRVAYEMEVWLYSVDSYMKQANNFIPSFVDMNEHTADLTAHRALNPRIERVNLLLQAMQDTNLLLGTDIYNSSMAYYRTVREGAKSNASGAPVIYADLKRQFASKGVKKTEE